ncbi:hypothetical protein [Natrinema sp. 74]|uniref:hypothetical protein n=1 Tax=Natrinema sp. 74 TaxID=3384159 RepID=UPI0038D45352
MAAHRPTAHRAFSILFVALLVGSVVAPIGATQPAAAESMSFEGTCNSPAQYVLFISCPHASWAVDDDPSSDEVVLHSIAVSESESLESQYQVQSNYLEDTATIASLEARHAIATAYENGNTSTEAYQKAVAAIRDYYAVQQINHVERLSKAMVQFSYIQNTTRSSSISDDFLSSSAYTDSGNNYNVQKVSVLDQRQNVSFELTNGTTHNISSLVLRYNYGSDGTWSGTETKPIAASEFSYNNSSDEFRFTADTSYSFGVYSDVQIIVMNAGGDLESQRVFDFRDWYEHWQEIQEQSDNVAANYDMQFVEDLYAEMDAGNVEPSQIRGAEGHARYLSGDSNVTSERFKVSVMSMLGTSNPDLNQTSNMVVSYTGYTKQNYTEVNGTRTVSYGGHVSNRTYEGLLYADEVPANGFVSGETYNVSSLNGTVSFYDAANGRYVQFLKGNVTIEAMYDRSGNKVQSVSWQKPQYGTYNASEFAAYMTKVERVQLQTDDGGLGFGLPNFGLPGGGSFVGLAIIGVAVLVVVGFVTDRIPGGN